MAWTEVAHWLLEGRDRFSTNTQRRPACQWGDMPIVTGPKRNNNAWEKSFALGHENELPGEEEACVAKNDVRKEAWKVPSGRRLWGPRFLLRDTFSQREVVQDRLWAALSDDGVGLQAGPGRHPLALTTLSPSALFLCAEIVDGNHEDDPGNDLDHHPQVRHPGHLCGR